VFKRVCPRASIRVECRDSGVASLSVSEYYALLVNSRLGVVVDYSCRDNTVVLFNGLRIPLRELVEIDIHAPLLGWKYNSSGFWELGDIKVKHPSITVIEVFNFKQYARLKRVEGSIVVDIGAGVGDSVIYFTLRGARRVVALEPNVKYYCEMLENIKLNNVEDRVVALNRAADSQTLLELVGEHGIDSGVLKVDCEGCEYEVLLNTPASTLQHFNEILVEYHGDPVPLARKLREAGFRVVVEKPWTYIRRKIPVGFIHTERSP